MIKIVNSSQTFNNSSSKFNIINKLPPQPNESGSHPDSSSIPTSTKRNEYDAQIINVEKQEQGKGSLNPDHDHAKAENTFHSPQTNQIEQM